MRLNVHQDQAIDKDKFKQELKKELGRPKVVKQYHRRPSLSCCSIFFVIFLALIIWALIIVARTGLVKIPVISSIFYQTPQPTRNITILPEEKEEISQQVYGKLGKILVDSISSGPDKIFQLNLTERELNWLVTEELTKQENIQLDQIQLVLLNQQIELFLKSFISQRDFYLTLILEPVLNGNKLNFNLGSVKIGLVKLPDWPAKLIFNKLVGPQINQSLEKINNLVEISKINVTEGQLEIDGKLKKLTE